MKASHTPGPWTLNRVAYSDASAVFVMSGKSTVCEVYPRPQGAESREANARLIAAAPTMLAALEVIAAWTPSASPNEPGGMSIMDAIDAARAAIARAKGG